MDGLTLWIETGITCWPEAVPYFLTNYSHAKNILKAVQDLGDTKRKSEKDEKRFSCRIIDAFSRCGKCIPEEVINTYIDGLTLAVNSLFRRFCHTREGCTYLEVVQQAESERDAFRARTALPSTGPIPRTTPVRQTRL